jgi:hypothetical protein
VFHFLTNGILALLGIIGSIASWGWPQRRVRRQKLKPKGASPMIFFIKREEMLVV